MSGTPDTSRTEAATTGAPTQLLEQLAAAISHQQGANSLAQRMEALEQRLDLLAERSGGGAGPGGATDPRLTERLKTLFSSVLVESGFLERLVGKTVDQRLEKSGGAGGVELREEAVKLTKDFLGANLGAILKKDVREAVRKELGEFLASEEMKVLLDDKFRAITLYLKTDVIPSTVRQALKTPAT